ncbi:putative ATP:guanido phosphotransferase [Peptococcaceae bacterium CEB3]|nr:putative ATP:guanido phosphotransferase [Peptococcaceae bacterium CEB3]
MHAIGSVSWNKVRGGEEMERKDLLLRRSAWMEETDRSRVVLSSRIRLARNLEDMPFPHVLSAEQAQKVEERLVRALETVAVEGEKLTYLSLGDLTPIERQVLTEKHLISPALVNSPAGRGVALAADHRVAVMVNEEDHIRLQILLPGNQLEETFRLADVLDDGLEEHLDYAYREAQGYLTACPTNVGTGLRASVMVHLPALAMTNRIQQVLGALAPLGLAVRGLYGEGSQAFGHIFQLSNQITLGKSEADILAHLGAVTGQIVEHELQARAALREHALLALEDKVWRARGTLEKARLLTSEDAMHLLSHDRLGVDMAILPKPQRTFAALLVESHPGCLQYVLNQELDAGQREAERAKFIREAFVPQADS